MSKIVIYADNHFSERSSLVCKFGSKYTARLENQIKTIEWIEDLALKNDAEIVCLGDFFDKSTLTDLEISAFNSIKFNNTLKKTAIVGNHESRYNRLIFSTTNLLTNAGYSVISQPAKVFVDDVEICYLPYIIESDRLSLKEYFGEKRSSKRIIFSHNDISGIQLGPIMSKTGFAVSDIAENCDLFVNGHLHNGQIISTKVINLGNITGKDFGEDAFRYTHSAMILDTETLKVEFIENPYAFNFYQLKIQNEKDLSILKKLKSNAVCSIICKSALNQTVRDLFASSLPEAIYKITNTLEILKDGETELNIDDLSSDNYLEKFNELCKQKIDNNNILEEELSEICK